MGRVAFFLWSSLISSLGGLACGGREVSNDLASAGGSTTSQVPTSADAAQPLEPAAYCDHVARTLCRVEVACCNVRGFAADEESCVRDRRAVSTWFEGQAQFGFNCSAESPTPEGYDATQAGLCATELARSISNCHALRKDDPAAARVDSACAQVIHRAPAALPGPGQPCPGYQCSAPQGMVSECVLGNDGAPNRCAQAVTARRAGESCLPGCASGLVCSAAGVCGAPAPDGGACMRPEQCASGSCENMTCGSPPPVPSVRCERLEDSARYQVQFEAPSAASEIAVTREHVAWAPNPGPTTGQRNALRVAEKDGSSKGWEVKVTSPVELREGVSPPVSEDGFLYFRSGDGIDRMSLESGERETFALLDSKSSREPWLNVFGVSGDALLLLGGSCESAAKLSLGSGVVEIHSDRVEREATDGTPHAASLANNVLYCAVGSRIVAFDFAGKASVLSKDSKLGESSEVRSLVRFAGRLYYLAGAKLFQLDLTTGNVVSLQPPLLPVTVSSLDAHNLQLDAARGQIYWMVERAIAVFEPPSGTFFSLPGGPAYVTAEHLESDADYLYWKSANGIFRRRKPD